MVFTIDIAVVGVLYSDGERSNQGQLGICFLSGSTQCPIDIEDEAHKCTSEHVQMINFGVQVMDECPQDTVLPDLRKPKLRRTTPAPPSGWGCNKVN